MGKVICTKKQTNKENGRVYKVNWVSGIVKDIRKPANDKAPMTVTVSARMKTADAEQWVEKDIRLNIWGDNITRISKMNLGVGYYVLATCGDIVEKEYNGHKTLSTTCWSLRYSTKWDIVDEKSTVTIIAGRVNAVAEMEDGTAIVTVKVRGYDKATSSAKDEEYTIVLTAEQVSEEKPASKGTLCAIGKMTGNTLKAKRADFAPYTPKAKKKD